MGETERLTRRRYRRGEEATGGSGKNGAVALWERQSGLRDDDIGAAKRRQEALEETELRLCGRNGATYKTTISARRRGDRRLWEKRSRGSVEKTELPVAPFRRGGERERERERERDVSERAVSLHQTTSADCCGYIRPAAASDASRATTEEVTATSGGERQQLPPAASEHAVLPHQTVSADSAGTSALLSPKRSGLRAKNYHPAAARLHLQRLPSAIMLLPELQALLL